MLTGQRKDLRFANLQKGPLVGRPRLYDSEDIGELLVRNAEFRHRTGGDFHVTVTKGQLVLYMN